jgi:hypothetical protein
VFPVKYELNFFYTLFRRNSVIKGLNNILSAERGVE